MTDYKLIKFVKTVTVDFLFAGIKLNTIIQEDNGRDKCTFYE